MKTTLLLLAVGFSISFPASNASAQYSARRLTRRIVPQQGAPTTPPNQQQRGAPKPAPAAPVPTPTPGTEPTQTGQAAVVRRPVPVPVVTRPVDPEKERAAQEKADQKAVEFEKQRADQDYGWAQYALGVRYMTGKGVDKDPEQARKWLQKAAKNGETQAVKKLAELDKEQTDALTGVQGDKPLKATPAEKSRAAEEPAGAETKVEKK